MVIKPLNCSDNQLTVFVFFFVFFFFFFKKNILTLLLPIPKCEYFQFYLLLCGTSVNWITLGSGQNKHLEMSYYVWKHHFHQTTTQLSPTQNPGGTSETEWFCRTLFNRFHTNSPPGPHSSSASLRKKGRFSTVWTLHCYHQIAMVTRPVLSVIAHTEWKGEMTAMGCQTKAALCVWLVKNTELWPLCTPATTQNTEKPPKNRNIFNKPQTIHRCQLPVYSVCYLNVITYCLVNIRGKKSPELPSLRLLWILQLCYQALLGYACYRYKTGAGSFSSSF